MLYRAFCENQAKHRQFRTCGTDFYHAMHYGAIAKRDLMFVCRPSVRPSISLSVHLSVTLVDQDHIGWKSWKLIARTLAQHLRSS